MKVMALACVAMIESPITHQRIVRPASRYDSTVVLPRARYRP